MADERTVTDEIVTDEELAAAFAASEEEIVPAKAAATHEEEPTAEELAAEEVATAGMSEAEKEEHKERSRLGRKLKGMKGLDDYLDKEVQKRLDAALSKRDIKPAAATATEEPDFDDEAEYERINTLLITSPIEGQEELAEYKATKQKITTQKYESGYLGQLEVVKNQEPSEIRDEVFNEMFEKKDDGLFYPRVEFNRAPTGNPAADAQINWANAKASLMSKKAAAGSKPTYKGRGDEVEAPIGAAGTHISSAEPGKTLPKLEGEAASLVAYLRSQGVSEEEIAADLAG